MKFSTVEKGLVTVIKLRGNLMGGPDATTLNHKLHELVEQGQRNVVIDLKDVEFMNSSGLGLLLGGASTLRNAGGALKLANASAKIMTLITISKLTPVFETFSSVKEAVESFSK